MGGCKSRPARPAVHSSPARPVVHSSPPRPFYVDVDPHYEWIQSPGSDTHVIHLPGFREEEVKFQVDEFENVKVNGQHDLGNNIWWRFHKQFRLPENCDSKNITRKFENETLYILIPKITETIEKDQPSTTQEPSSIRESEADVKKLSTDVGKPPQATPEMVSEVTEKGIEKREESMSEKGSEESIKKDEPTTTQEPSSSRTSGADVGEPSTVVGQPSQATPEMVTGEIEKGIEKSEEISDIVRDLQASRESITTGRPIPEEGKCDDDGHVILDKETGGTETLIPKMAKKGSEESIKNDEHATMQEPSSSRASGTDVREPSTVVGQPSQATTEMVTGEMEKGIEKSEQISDIVRDLQTSSESITTGRPIAKEGKSDDDRHVILDKETGGTETLIPKMAKKGSEESIKKDEPATTQEPSSSRASGADVGEPSTVVRQPSHATPKMVNGEAKKGIEKSEEINDIVRDPQASSDSITTGRPIPEEGKSDDDGHQILDKETRGTETLIPKMPEKGSEESIKKDEPITTQEPSSSRASGADVREPSTVVGQPSQPTPEMVTGEMEKGIEKSEENSDIVRDLQDSSESITTGRPISKEGKSGDDGHVILDKEIGRTQTLMPTMPEKGSEESIKKDQPAIAQKPSSSTTSKAYVGEPRIVVGKTSQATPGMVTGDTKKGSKKRDKSSDIRRDLQASNESITTERPIHKIPIEGKSGDTRHTILDKETREIETKMSTMPDKRNEESFEEKNFVISHEPSSARESREPRTTVEKPSQTTLGLMATRESSKHGESSDIGRDPQVVSESIIAERPMHVILTEEMSNGDDGHAILDNEIGKTETMTPTMPDKGVEKSGKSIDIGKPSKAMLGMKSGEDDQVEIVEKHVSEESKEKKSEPTDVEKLLQVTPEKGYDKINEVDDARANPQTMIEKGSKVEPEGKMARENQENGKSTISLADGKSSHESEKGNETIEGKPYEVAAKKVIHGIREKGEKHDEPSYAKKPSQDILEAVIEKNGEFATIEQIVRGIHEKGKSDITIYWKKSSQDTPGQIIEKGDVIVIARKPPQATIEIRTEKHLPNDSIRHSEATVETWAEKEREAIAIEKEMKGLMKKRKNDGHIDAKKPSHATLEKEIHKSNELFEVIKSKQAMSGIENIEIGMAGEMVHEIIKESQKGDGFVDARKFSDMEPENKGEKDNLLAKGGFWQNFHKYGEDHILRLSLMVAGVALVLAFSATYLVRAQKK